MDLSTAREDYLTLPYSTSRHTTGHHLLKSLDMDLSTAREDYLTLQQHTLLDITELHITKP